MNHAIAPLTSLTLWVAGLPIESADTFRTIANDLYEFLAPYGAARLISGEPRTYRADVSGWRKLGRAIDAGRVHQLTVTSASAQVAYPHGRGVIEAGQTESPECASLIDVRLLGNSDHPLSSEAAVGLVKMSRRWVGLLPGVAAFVSDSADDSALVTRMERKKRTMYPRSLKVLRHGHRGAFWSMFLGAAQCDLLGGQGAVLRDAPNAIAEEFLDGIWIQFSDCPPSSAGATLALEEYLQPLFAWMDEEPSQGTTKTEPKLRLSVKRADSDGTADVRLLPTVPSRILRNRRAVPYRTQFGEDTHALISIHLLDQPTEDQVSALTRSMGQWISEGPSFTSPHDDWGSLSLVQGPRISDRVVRWSARFHIDNPRAAVRRLAQLLAQVDGVRVERLFVGDE